MCNWFVVEVTTTVVRKKSTMIYDTVNGAPEPVSFPLSNVRFCVIVNEIAGDLK